MRRDSLQQHRITLRPPSGLKAEPAELVGTVGPKSRQSFKVKLTPDPDKLPAGVQMVPMDITLDGKRYGELFDFVVQSQFWGTPGIPARVIALLVPPRAAR